MKKKALIAGAMLGLALPTALSATATVATSGTDPIVYPQENDDDFPVGLLGLLGLAGLLGLKRRHDHVHVDRTVPPRGPNDRV